VSNPIPNAPKGETPKNPQAPTQGAAQQPANPKVPEPEQQNPLELAGQQLGSQVKAPAQQPPARPKAVAPEAAQDPDIYNVTDTTAVPGGPPRVHTQIIDGIETNFTFKHGEALAMPRAHAMKFARHREFIVRDAASKRVQPVHDVMKREVDVKLLQPGQVIAEVRELTMDALLNRAQTLPGGERFGRNSQREDVMLFITQTMIDAQGEVRSGDTGDMADSDVARLLGHTTGRAA